jgi:hypothetical protein
MKRCFERSLLCLVPLASALALAASAAAAPDGTMSVAGVTSPSLLALIGNDDVFATTDLSALLDPAGTGGTQHYGSYPSTSPDSGTCGNDWAEDTFDRDFTVRSNGDGTFTVVEQFKNGSFATTGGASPGACETNPGGTVLAGVTGSMHGYFVISNVGTQTSTSPYCDAAASTNADCTTATFVDTHFAPCYGTTCNVTTYFFHYAAGDQSLLFHEWKNASADRGGDSGDIANT